MASARVANRNRGLGAAFVVCASLFQFLWLGLPALFVSVGLAVSFALWAGSDWRVDPGLSRAFALAVVLFAVHVAEEFLTGLPSALPELFGRAAWSEARYLVFNGAWAAVFAATALAVRPGRSFPVLVVLFYAVAGGVGNGIVHLALVLMRGAYFPGAWTAPLCLAAGIWLLRLLYGSRPSAERPSLRDT